MWRVPANNFKLDASIRGCLEGGLGGVRNRDGLLVASDTGEGGGVTSAGRSGTVLFIKVSHIQGDGLRILGRPRRHTSCGHSMHPRSSKRNARTVALLAVTGRGDG